MSKVYMQDVDKLVQKIAGTSKLVKRQILTFLSNNHIDIIVPREEETKKSLDNKADL